VAGQTGERAAKRTEIIEPLVTEDGRLVFDRDRASEFLGDIVSTLIAVGGSVRIVSDRVLMGKLPEDGDGRREPVGQTVGLVVEYTTQGPLHKESLTLHLVGSMYEEQAAAAPPQGPSLAEAMAGATADEEPVDAPELEDDETGQKGEEEAG
jgi:hypothetical protein